MNTLRANVTDYLATRRAMGFKVEGLSKLLLSFVAFCEARGATRVQNDLAVEWATARIKVPVSDALFARRMDAVRIFARYQHALDPATEIPAEALRQPAIPAEGAKRVQRGRDRSLSLLPRTPCPHGSKR